VGFVLTKQNLWSADKLNCQSGLKDFLREQCNGRELVALMNESRFGEKKL
jgi:hypothetical protein